MSMALFMKKLIAYSSFPKNIRIFVPDNQMRRWEYILK
jgi:hypothetical protein